MMSSRREVLAALLGLPLAALDLGCRRRVLPPGEIVGADVTSGHLIRGDLPPLGDPSSHVPVLIIGAGISGLGAAWRLAAVRDLPVTMVELESEVGGTARCGKNAVSQYPWAGHYIPMPSNSNPALVRLLREMDVIEGVDALGDPVAREQFLVTEPEERVFYQGRWHEGIVAREAIGEADAAEMDRFHRLIDSWVERRDGQGRRAFASPMSKGSDDSDVTALDKISMATWLDQNNLRSSHLRWFVDYACRDDYGCTLDNTSAWAGIFYFASRQNKAAGSSAPLLAWPEGNGAIARHLAAKTRSSIRTGELACDVVPSEDHVDVVLVDARSKSARTIRADRVILAVPRFIASRLLRPWRHNPPADLREFETSPWLVANLTLRDRPKNVGFVPAWDNVIYQSPSLGYVLATHQRGRSFGPTVFTYYYALTDSDPRRAREKLFTASRDEWVEVVLRDLSVAHSDIFDLTQKVDLYRWGHAMVRPRPGFVWGQARRHAAGPFFGRVHMAHTDLSGVALLEEALTHGVRAAEEVLRGQGRLVDTWL